MNGPLGTFECPDGIKAALEPFFAPILENEFVIKREATAGEIVFVDGLDRHRLASGWIELPVTGVYEVRGRRIVMTLSTGNASGANAGRRVTSAEREGPEATPHDAGRTATRGFAAFR